ncbi:MAG: ureidoglycolate lyase [Xanthomonadaceae bacterium]|nr:ureidoglycolate lyase [Xanthomonadaceae bacterium]MDP2186262.1 ureidoglycolate lyase [Xanthomonadales bacterium]MDZ4117643.1 ureidoglycolate lyase [Xanthomonadaceae bacterium]MDZ4376542.1 ureidoglycolate lyase [Xanthomonadaceae bacterium]
MTDRSVPLPVEALSSQAFAPFGDVIDSAGAANVIRINDGTAQRFHALALIDADADGGKPVISIFRAQPRELPFMVRMLERHPLGSQAFMPLAANPYLVVVGSSPDAVPRAFLAQPGQGINLHRGVWHHPLLALKVTSDFLVIDRSGAGNNCDEVQLRCAWQIQAAAIPG